MNWTKSCAPSHFSPHPDLEPRFLYAKDVGGAVCEGVPELRMNRRKWWITR